MRYHLQKDVDSIKQLITHFDTNRKIIISDVDGILNNGVLGYTKDGKVMKYFGCYDKEAIDIAANSLHWDVLFVSDDKVGWDITEARLSHIKKLNPELINYTIANSKERKDLVKKYIDDGYKVLFIGDSLSDIPALNIATISATTNNALDQVKNYVDYVSKRNGGEGGFADIISELIFPNTFLQK